MGFKIESFFLVHPPEKACFLNRNSKDFDAHPDIVDELDNVKYQLISHFGNGLNFGRSQTSKYCSRKNASN